MSQRSRAREVVFQVLYQEDLNPCNDPADGDALIKSRLDSDNLVGFAMELVTGVRRMRDELDARIEQAAENWSLHRMAATDRNVIRLGAYEIFYTDTPDRVAVDEAIELSKRFGSGKSAQVVNGILDRLMHVER